ncbi:MAG: zinc metalloprotease HtpX [Candidatus Limnocylindria bacterium]|nr:zinc metalloprotease HtpX [Candidatus Limnocylindria bacterium]
MNNLKTLALLTVLTLSLVVGGRLLAAPSGMGLGLVLAVVMNLGSYWFSDKIALKMAGARPLEESEAPDIYRIVRMVATKANLSMPRVYLIEQAAPNAFATGRDPQHAAVAVTAGILEVVDARELTAVLAHEIGHVSNRDTLVMAVAASIAGAISFLAQMAQWSMFFGGSRDDEDRTGGIIGLIAGMIFLPLAATVVQLAISRSREYGADETSAALTHDPMALASALRKLDAYSKRVPLNVNPSVSPLFIVRPLLPGGFGGLFSTHPPIEERIARLEKMAGQR